MIRPADKDLVQRLGSTTAFNVMCADVLTVPEDMLIEGAIRLMTEKRLKRLPVIDDAGRFKSMISRNSLFRTGYGRLS